MFIMSGKGPPFGVVTLQGWGVPSIQGLDTNFFCLEALSFRLIFELRNTILTCVRIVEL
jgi:hypothetical protein